MQGGGDPNFSPQGVNNPNFSGSNIPPNPQPQIPQPQISQPQAPQPQPIQPMPYPSQPPVTPADSGDIIIGSSPSESRKKPVIILIVLVVILIAAGTGFAIWQTQNNNGDGESGNNDTPHQAISLPPREAYDRFADYIIWGPQKPTDISEDVERSDVPAEDTYLAVLAGTGSYEDHQAGFNTIMENLDILQRATGDNAELTEQLSKLKEYLMNLDYLTAVSQTDIVLQKYLEGGEDAVEEYLDSMPEFQSMAVTESIEGLVEGELSQYVTATEVGCLTQEGLKDACYEADLGDTIMQTQYAIDVFYPVARRLSRAIVSFSVGLINALQEEVYE